MQHDPVAWATNVTKALNPKAVDQQLNSLYKQIPYLHDRVLEKYPDLEQNADGTFKLPMIYKVGPPVGSGMPTFTETPITNDGDVQNFNVAIQNWNKRNATYATYSKAKAFLNTRK
jgi:hypothetical protein